MKQLIISQNVLIIDFVLIDMVNDQNSNHFSYSMLSNLFLIAFQRGSPNLQVEQGIHK